MKSTFLLVMGILMTVFGGYGVYGNVSSAGIYTSMGMPVYLIVLYIIVSTLELIGGLIGLMNWRRPKRAKLCIFIGCTMILIQLTNFIIGSTTVFSQYGSVNIGSFLLGLVIPLLYILSAFLFIRSANAAFEDEVKKAAELKKEQYRNSRNNRKHR